MSDSMRFDSLINTLSGLGSTRDRTTQTRVSEIAELDVTELEVLYRRNHYAARIVDLAPDEATRRGFRVMVSGSDEGGKAFEEEFRRLNLIPACNQANKWARLYGGGAVILGIDDGRDPSEPIDLEGMKNGATIAKCIDFVHVLDRHSLTPLEIERNPRSPGFNLPARYAINFRDQASFSSSIGNSYGFGSVIHASRMLRFSGVPLPPALRSDQDWWGDSVLQRIYESLANLGMLERSIGNIGQTFTQSVLKMHGLRQLVKSKDAEKQLIDRFTAMNLSQSVLSMMVIDAEGEEYEKRTTSVSGLDALYDRIAQSFTAASEMPVTLLFGSSPGGLSTDDESGTRNWENNIRSAQANRYAPALEYVAHIIACTEDGPEDSDASIKVEAVPLREPTEDEQSKTAKTWAEFAAILIDRGVLRPNEVRKSFFDGTGFNSQIILESDEDDEIEPAPAAEAPQEESELIDELIKDALESSDERRYEPPQEVRAAARLGLALRKEFNRGSGPVGVARGRDLARGASFGIDTINRMASFFARHGAQLIKTKEAGWENEENPSAQWIAWLLWGGDPGRDWVERIKKELEKRDISARIDPYHHFGEAPRNVRETAYKQKWSAEQKAKWVEVFNASLERYVEAGIEEKEAESTAIAVATHAITHQA